MATLLGMSFVVHQVGSALGAWGGGLIFDLTGSYTPAWQIGTLIGIQRRPRADSSQAGPQSRAEIRQHSGMAACSRRPMRPSLNCLLAELPIA